MCTLTRDLYFILWRDTATTICWSDPLWNTLGCLSDCHDCIRIGGPPRELERISHEVSRKVTGTFRLMSSYVNLCWVIGQFIASGVLVGVQPRLDVWGWKIPFAVQWVYSPLLSLLFYSPCRSGPFPSFLCASSAPSLPRGVSDTFRPSPKSHH